MKRISTILITIFLIFSIIFLLVASHPFVKYETLNLKPIVLFFHKPSLIILIFSYISLLVIGFLGLLKARYLTGTYGLGFIISNFIALLIVVSQQGIPRIFTDTIFLLIGIGAFLGRKSFSKVFFIYLLIIFISSFYTILQFPLFGLNEFLPVALTHSLARPSGFLMINGNASLMAISFTILDINIKEAYSNFTNKKLFINLHLATKLTIILALILSASRGAILVTIFVFISKRIKYILKFLTQLKVKRSFFIISLITISILIVTSIFSDYESSGCYACQKIYSFDFSNDFSIYGRLDQFNNPLKYLFGTNNLSMPDSVGDNPWLEYTLDYGLIFTFLIITSFISLYLNNRKFIKLDANNSLARYLLESINYALFTITLLMFLYDSPQSIPSYSSLIILAASCQQSVYLNHKNKI